ncbi:hypothetical protein HK102_014064, partial [Quaeritorhiza haematococci]
MKLFQLAVVACLAALIPPSSADDAHNYESEGIPAPPGVEILSFTHGGTGCQPYPLFFSPTNLDPSSASTNTRDITQHGSRVTMSLNPTQTTLTILYDKLSVQWGPHQLNPIKRIDCQIDIRLKIPHTWSYSIASLETRGHASLEDDVRGNITTTTYFQGQMEPEEVQRISQEVVGPWDEDYAISTEVGGEALRWSPCKRFLHRGMV